MEPWGGAEDVGAEGPRRIEGVPVCVEPMVAGSSWCHAVECCRVAVCCGMDLGEASALISAVAGAQWAVDK